MEKLILITGATGNQGGAVVQAALARGLRLRALVRDSKADKAKALAQKGIELVEGEFDDAASLDAALDGVHAAFLVTTPFAGIEKEIEQGKAFIDAAKRAGLPHLVFSSVSDAEKNTGIPHFDSKLELEKHLVASGVPHTITAPTFFFENLLFPWNLQDLKSGRFRQALPGDIQLQMVSTDDIGRLNALVLEQGERFLGQRINYAGDALTPEEMTRVIEKAAGTSLVFEEQPLEEVSAQFEDMAIMYAWLKGTGFSVDIEALHKRLPEVEWTSFAAWAARKPWSSLLS